jgi:hypothetical protein
MGESKCPVRSDTQSQHAAQVRGMPLRVQGGGAFVAVHASLVQRRHWVKGDGLIDVDPHARSLVITS